MATSNLENTIPCQGNSHESIQGDLEVIAVSPPKGPEADSNESLVEQSELSSVKSSDPSFRPASISKAFRVPQLFSPFKCDIIAYDERPR